MSISYSKPLLKLGVVKKIVFTENFKHIKNKRHTIQRVCGKGGEEVHRELKNSS